MLIDTALVEVHCGEVEVEPATGAVFVKLAEMTGGRLVSVYEYATMQSESVCAVAHFAGMAVGYRKMLSLFLTATGTNGAGVVLVVRRYLQTPL